MARENKNCYQMSSFQEAKATRFLIGNPVVGFPSSPSHRFLFFAPLILAVPMFEPCCFPSPAIACVRACLCECMSVFNTVNPVLTAQDFVDYNKMQLSRIYPNGTRVKSTNYNPQAYWNVGSQLVSLNYQTITSVPMQLNLGKFEVNGRSGYVLKPPPMTNDKSFNPFEALQIDEIVSLNLSVTVLSLQVHNCY